MKTSFPLKTAVKANMLEMIDAMRKAMKKTVDEMHKLMLMTAQDVASSFLLEIFNGVNQSLQSILKVSCDHL